MFVFLSRTPFPFLVATFVSPDAYGKSYSFGVSLASLCSHMAFPPSFHILHFTIGSCAE